ncbi:MAG: hypothetical protein DYG93_11930 [Leptolyngbya sp. PLA2]|nr:hypothetical protein [Leptolyngbya sp.]MCE7972354.1 hypothetical protein [Leptolyngbya sp. PL-A2]MCZ7632493.1 hypothetical protein [Phycisphaerales bacterium]MDL1905051.1 hypothetical protein [Synechococcales cyanobacterium CNB]GIK19951.1 MAG: hypothetical protein BroJett004_21150 [Planctomycetota bacterium]
MAKRPDLSGHQRRIVQRYYDNLGTISVQKLQEIVSDLALADDPKQAERLWKRAETALAKTAANDAEARTALAERNLQKLAQVVARLA